MQPHATGPAEEAQAAQGLLPATLHCTAAAVREYSPVILSWAFRHDVEACRLWQLVNTPSHVREQLSRCGWRLPGLLTCNHAASV